MQRATVLLADDHAIVAEGLASLLQGEFALVGTVTNGSELVEAARRLRPDLIVTDLAMPGLSGLDALRQLKAEGIAARVIVLTMHANAHVAAEVLRAGASGFVVKHAAGQELIAALHAVLRGRRYVNPDLAEDVLAALAEPSPPATGTLTPRQRDVVRLLAEGRTMKEVARTLGITPRTVAYHKYTMMEELGIQSSAELVHYAVKHRLVAE